MYGYARLPRICNKGLIVTTFSELLPGVAAGHWDINVPLFVTAERAELVAFSVPVWALYDGFLVRTGHAGHLTSYEGLARAGDALLGVITGQVQHDAARRFGVPELRINQYEHQQEAIDALLEGRIDVYASTALGNRTLVQRMGNAALSAVSHDLAAATPYVPPKGAFSFAKANVDLRNEFDIQLRKYVESPDHRSKMERYGLTAAEIDPVVMD
ncbi:transporter substrate-binding domain-containing protein [Caballeronia sordidicola]|uniref:transporter substrate-binding domain-containing protein n=1 Tax=Caballeronia sordidicola TaxID=196367 RepID=UPI000B05FF57|nr:transporter substrate-binding domain-containing protein [Caballeronia sordidicola]